MSRNPTSFSLLGALICLAGAPARGQSPAPAPADSSPVFTAAKPSPPATPPADDDHGDTRRIKSDELAGALASAMPKYDPPKPAKPEADQQDADKPKNGIIRLPKYVVKEPKPPVFRERDLHSRSEMTDIGLRRYLGLNIGNFGGLNRPVSLLMYQEQERLNNIADLKEDAKNAKRSGDSAASDYIMRENNRVNYRPSDFGWNSDSPISDTRK